MTTRVIFVALAAVAARGATSSDNFNRANEAPLTSPWAAVYGVINLTSNQFTGGSAQTAAFRYSTLSPGAAQWAQVRITGAGVNNYAGPAVRMSVSAADFYDCQVSSSGTLYLRRTKGGATTDLTNSPGSISVNDMVRLSAAGSNPVTLYCWLNNTLRITYADYSADRLTSGQVGIATYGNSGVTFGDDWEGGDPTVASVTVSSLGDTDAHIRMVLNGATDSYLCYSTSTFTDCTTSGTLNRTYNDGTSPNPEFVLYGLTANTQYFYALYTSATNRLGNGGAGAPPYTFTTAAASTHPAAPTPPASSGITGITPTSGFDASSPLTVNGTCTNLQSHINTAAADSGADNWEIIVPTTVTGCSSMVLKPHSGTGKIIIRSDRSPRLPPDNARVVPAYDQQHMFKLRPPIGTTAITCEPGAKGYIVLGIDIQAPAGSQTVFQTDFGNCTESYIDRSYLNALDSPNGSATIVRLNGSLNGLLNSYVYSNHPANGPSAVALDCGDRNLVRNNHLKGLGVTFFLTADCLPTTGQPNKDITISRNTISHIGTEDYTRQASEIKSCLRCLFNGNRYDPYPADDIGNTAALLITPRIGSGGCNAIGGAKAVVTDIDFRRNLILRNGAGLISLDGHDDTPGCEPFPVRRVRVVDNIVSHIDTSFCLAGGPGCEPRGHMFGLDGCTDCQFRNNTLYESTFEGRGRILTIGGQLCGHCRVDDNILVAGTGEGSRGVGWNGYGWPDSSDPQALTPKQKLDRIWTNYTFTNNVIRVKSPNTTADLSPRYPAGNFWPGDNAAGLANIGFDPAASTLATAPRSFRLSEFTSQYRNRASDGRSVGARYIGVMEETGGVERMVVSAVTTASIRIGFAAFGGLTRPGQACKADANTSSIFADAPVRVTATVNAAIPSWQTAEFAGLTSGTNYYIRIHCGGEPYIHNQPVRTQ